MEKQQGKSGLLLDLATFSLNGCIFDKTPPPPLLERQRGDQEGRRPGLPVRAPPRVRYLPAYTKHNAYRFPPPVPSPAPPWSLVFARPR